MLLLIVSSLYKWDSKGAEIVRCDSLVERRLFTLIRDVWHNWHFGELCLNYSGLDDNEKGVSSWENWMSKEHEAVCKAILEKNILLEKDYKKKKQACILNPTFKMSGEQYGLKDFWFVYVIFCLILSSCRKEPLFRTVIRSWNCSFWPLSFPCSVVRSAILVLTAFWCVLSSGFGGNAFMKMLVSKAGGRTQLSCSCVEQLHLSVSQLSQI